MQGVQRHLQATRYSVHMSIAQQLQDRIERQTEKIEALEEQLPGLKSRLEHAEHEADRIESDLLLRDASEGLFEDSTQSTDEALRRAKVAANQRRKALEQHEREARVARHLRDRLQTTLQTLQDEDVDGQLRELDERAPQVAERLATAWETYVAAAEEADEITRQRRRLKARIPVGGVSLGLTHAIPRFPGLEEVRAKQPHQSQRHPASILRKHGYTELADRLTEGR